MELITKRQIVRELGNRERTFFWWKELGLIPRPVKVQKIPKKGTISYYDKRVLQTIKNIKLLKKAGKTLREIKELISEAMDFQLSMGVDITKVVTPHEADTILELHERVKRVFPEDNPVTIISIFDEGEGKGITVNTRALLGSQKRHKRD